MSNLQPESWDRDNLIEKNIKITYEGQSPTNPMLKDKIEKKKKLP
jgi:hypothetical protein